MLTRARQGFIAILLLVAASQGVAAELIADSLPMCPSSPNCVSSMTSDAKKRVAPIHTGVPRDQAMKRLINDLERRKRVVWRQVGDNVIKAQFSTLMGFKDDVMFVVQDDGDIHVRSASRLGYWDLGANRKRVENLREKLERRY